MTIEQNLNRMADAFERIANALEKLGNAPAAVPAPVTAADEVPAAPKTTKKQKAEATPAAAPVAAPAAETKPEPAPAAAETKPVTRDDVRAVARKLIAGSVPDTELQGAIHEIAGVRKISEIAEDKLAAVFAKFNSMLP